jgi:hypothetical protein
LLLFSVNCFADALILVPIEAHLNANDSLELGKAMPGQELKLIVSDTSFREDGLLWEKAEINLPNDWELIYFNKDDKSLELLIKIPESISSNIYNLKLILSSPSKSIESEEFFLKIIISNDSLISVSSPKLFVEGKTGKKANYSLLISNNSICSQKIFLSSTLPVTWFEPASIEVPHNSVKEILVTVIPQQTMKKDFSFKLINEKKTFASINAVIDSKPSFEGKFYSFIAGFPIYSISLIPFNLFNSLIGFLLM